MWANSEHDGRPAEYRWRPVLKAAKCGARPLLKRRAVTLPKCESARWRMQTELCTWQNSVMGQQPPKMYMLCTSAGDGQTPCKVWLASVERRRCSNAAKMRNPLKFAGVPQTTRPISATSGLTSTILWGHVEEILLLNKFFSDCRYVCALVPKT